MERNENMNRDSSVRQDYWGGEQLDSGSWASDDMDPGRFTASSDDLGDEYDDYDMSPDEGMEDDSWDNRGMESSGDPDEQEHTMPYRSDRHNGWTGNPMGDGGSGSQGGEP